MPNSKKEAQALAAPVSRSAKDVYIHIRMTKDLRDKLLARCEAEGRLYSKVVRQFVETLVRSTKKKETSHG